MKDGVAARQRWRVQILLVTTKSRKYENKNRNKGKENEVKKSTEKLITDMALRCCAMLTNISDHKEPKYMRLEYYSIYKGRENYINGKHRKAVWDYVLQMLWWKVQDIFLTQGTTNIRDA